MRVGGFDPSAVAKGNGSDRSLGGGRLGGGDPGAGVGPRAAGPEQSEAVGGGRESGNHPSKEDGLQAFEVWRVGWVKTSTRLEARGFGG